MLAAAAIAALAAFNPQLPQQVDRRAVLSGAASAALLAPLPAFARSKEKAAEKAMQKATAGEARQAMKEYKFAPRPELVGNAETGYSYKSGTVKDGSTGEMASYFKDKGAKIQGEYQADRARATGATADQAAKLAAETEDKLRKQRAAEFAAKRAKKGQDEIAIAQFCKTNPGAVDQLGRSLCTSASGKGY